MRLELPDELPDEPGVQPKRNYPPPQCITCSRFVNVKTARCYEEHGEFGTFLSAEFECQRCAERHA